MPCIDFAWNQYKNRWYGPPLLGSKVGTEAVPCRRRKHGRVAHREFGSETAALQKSIIEMIWGEEGPSGPPPLFDSFQDHGPLWVIYQLNGFLNPYSKVHYDD